MRQASRVCSPASGADKTSGSDTLNDRVSVKPARLAHASFITANLREADQREIFCQLPDGFKTYEVAALMLGAGDAFIAYLDDTPVCFFGAHPLNICTLDAWAMGTNQTRRVIHAVTRHMITEYGPAAIDAGFLSMECRSHVDHHEAHRWLKSTGAVANGTPFVYGKNGEKFQLFRWDRDALGVAATRYKVSHVQSSERPQTS
jgi:hypothetical protein